MEEVNLNVSSLNDNEIIQLLLNALRLSNEKSLSLSEKVSILQEQKLIAESDRSNAVSEKERIKDSLNDKISQLNVQLQKAEETHTKSNNKYEAELLKKSALIEEKELKLGEKDETIRNLEAQKQSVQNEYDSFRIRLLQKTISTCFNHVKQEFLCCESNAGIAGLKSYIQDKTSNSEILFKDYNNVDNLCQILLSPDGCISFLCNLRWWFYSETIKNAYKELTPLFERVSVEVNHVLDILNYYGYDVKIPSKEFNDNIPNYELYDNEISRVEKLFPEVQWGKSVLCEIYVVSYNEKKGKCYSL